jgi:hypothetical protein
VSIEPEGTGQRSDTDLEGTRGLRPEFGSCWLPPANLWAQHGQKAKGSSSHTLELKGMGGGDGGGLAAGGLWGQSLVVPGEEGGSPRKVPTLHLAGAPLS